MRVVLDTNVLVSGLNFYGNEHTVIEFVRQGRIELVTSPFILLELTRVLTRKFEWSEVETIHAVRSLAELADVVDPPQETVEVAGNPADNRILDCVLAASADYLVTGDRRHLLPLRRLGVTRFVTASEFLSLFEG